jgi:elongator complex protein 3
MNFLKQLLKEIETGKIKTKEQLSKRKRALARGTGKNQPDNAKILEMAKGRAREKVRKLLQIKPTRTISGVAVVAVMCKPHKCPHGKCTYCPHVENVPESYTGKEPAARRAIANKFDPYKQVQNRLTQLYATGHIPEKVELIIMGGTFPSLSRRYQKNFIKNCLLAMNRFPKDKPKKIPSLESIQKTNETTKIRCVGMTFETRPDYCKKKHVDFMLKLGGTRVELGVQTIYDYIYKKVNRGHTVKDVIKATRLLKDSGFKVLYHMMPGLPGSNLEKDIAMFIGGAPHKETFWRPGILNDPDFSPDMLKIYPCLVIPGSELYKDWKKGKYKPYTEKQAKAFLKKIKEGCPEWVRIMRIERDIPGTEIAAGIKTTNIRQMLGKTKCDCIRCREVGHRLRKGFKLDEKSIHLNLIFYTASKGKEIFLEFIDKNHTLLGFLRLRLNKTETALVRELHVYGEQIPIGKKGKIQHKGYGKKLLKKAEQLAKMAGKKKISVISGIGVREYYRRLGYKKDKTYMSKRL